MLVILGLLTGGILTGQNLIRAAELRKLTTRVTTLQAAAHTFRDKYFALPGDMQNATDFWGAAAASGSCADTPSSGTETCNGDGDGKVEEKGWVAGTISNEMYRFWQHLANAGLIEGQYSGISGAISTAPNANQYTEVSGENCYATIAESCFRVKYDQNPVTSADTKSFERPQSNVLMVLGNILTPEEAWSFDKKLDDGRPGQGFIRGNKKSSIYSEDCSTTNDPETAEYDVANGVSCQPHIIGVF